LLALWKKEEATLIDVIIGSVIMLVGIIIGHAITKQESSNNNPQVTFLPSLKNTEEK
jgi:hypothetical protein